MKVLMGLYYTEEHEWVKISEGKAYIGITDYAQHELGDIVFVELPEVDAELKKGEAFGTIESVKAASDIYMPLDGKIVEVNEIVIDEPNLINEDAFENWMIAIELSDEGQMEDLMSSEEYKEFCKRG